MCKSTADGGYNNSFVLNILYVTYLFSIFCADNAQCRACNLFILNIL